MIKKALLYFVVFVAVLYAMRELMYIGLRRNRLGVYEKYNTMFLKENKNDVLFLGSSRAEMHFDPCIFDSVTGHNSYNIGVTGATPRIAFGVLKAWCSKSQLPNTVVFDLDWHFLWKATDTVRLFPRYFPYLSNDALLEQFNQIDSRFCSFKYNAFHSLPYSKWRLLSASLYGWLGKTGKYDSLYYKGHLGLEFIDSLKPMPIHPRYTFINRTERCYIDSVIAFARNNNIKLILVTSPMFVGGKAEILNKDFIVNQLKNIAISNGIGYYDFSQRYFSGNRRYFADYYHMNQRGAQIFSLEFARFFSQYFDKKDVR